MHIVCLALSCEVGKTEVRLQSHNMQYAVKFTNAEVRVFFRLSYWSTSSRTVFKTEVSSLMCSPILKNNVRGHLKTH